MSKKGKKKVKNPYALCTWIAKQQGWPIRGKKWEECVLSVKAKRHGKKKR